MVRGRDSKSRRRVKEHCAQLYWLSLFPVEDEETPASREDEDWSVIDGILSDIEELTNR